MRITGFICLTFLLPSIILVVPRLPPKQSQVSKKDLSDALKDPRYSLLVVAMFFVFWGMFLPFYYLPLYGLSHHMTVDMANNLVATLNAGSFVGRLASGLLADKFGRYVYLQSDPRLRLANRPSMKASIWPSSAPYPPASYCSACS